MVDFNNETTATVAPQALIKILILQRRHDFIEAQEHYYKFLSEDVETFISLDMVVARLRSLYLEIQGIVNNKRYMTEEERTDFLTVFASDPNKKIEDVVYKFSMLNKVLYNMGLLRIDNRKEYDATRVEKSNDAFNI